MALTHTISLVVELPLSVVPLRDDLPCVDGGTALEARVGVKQEGGLRLPVVVGHLDPVPLGRELLDERAVAVPAVRPFIISDSILAT